MVLRNRADNRHSDWLSVWRDQDRLVPRRVRGRPRQGLRDISHGQARHLRFEARYRLGNARPVLHSPAEQERLDQQRADVEQAVSSKFLITECLRLTLHSNYNLFN